LIIKEEDHELYHYGIKRRSGRYPWGSGQTPEERGTSFLGILDDLRKQGLSDTEIASQFSSKEHPFNTTHLRATIAIAGNAKKAADISMAQRLKEKGMSNSAIAERMYGSKSKESTVRALLAPGAKDKADILTATSDMLRNRVDKDGFIDIGKGVGNQLGMAPTKLNTAVAMLESEGYKIHKVPIPQLGTGHETNTKVLCPPGTEWKDVMQNRDKIVPLSDYTPDGGRRWVEPQPPLSLDSKRVRVKYKEDGGDKEDGVIYVRPGAKDLDMGGSHYVQTRILVDGTHYLKGMAVLKDDLPEGVDVLFNTNKSKGTPMMGPKDNTVLKPIQKGDPTNPFGASIGRQVLDHNDKVKSVINIVNEEANWDDWSRNLASQFLSKQKPELVKSQLDVTYAKKKDQLDEILSLNNPTVKERLLRSYADDMDSSAVHLKAAAMPRQKTHVILPINSLKENEIYAPGYRDGETVVLVRYPHGGKFEIPELVVNNRNPQGNKLIHPDSRAAVGINHKVAARLSGADFDGDTVVVIPNNHKRISTEPPLERLKGFDPQREYPKYPGMKVMSNTQTEMGKISNLITDMTIRGANHDELAKAVRHSMVVIDAEKHELDYKRSAIENDIAGLRKKYQVTPGRPQGGASTIISRTSGDVTIQDRKLRPASEGGPIDRKTGKLVYVPTNKTYNKRVVDPKTGEVSWVPTPKTVKVQRGSLVDNAFDLIEGEGTPVERMYAGYSNSVRALADKARLELVHNTKPLPYRKDAKQVYAKEVASLNVKLNEALKNAPLERQAQVIANAKVKLRKQAEPQMDADALKKISSQELKKARARTGALKQQVDITPNEWAAIQAGAITHTKLKAILDNADIDKIKELATPRTTVAMSPTKVSRARALSNAGYTQAEIADELGISVSTLRRGLTG
jgi:hypothetical protein